ncbi:SUMF1/EgtB/PvdO family nonheme iron enzyme [Telmatocola sphagniphila]|uniref:SUMF1/EgtB/PvdO family nonheme iron enzyme n=1 Tax=Telmatocola sphagniphila TaxID=1123043 RepID=A0A8E6B2Z7_9BACT|nr:SUMF1/EgtB/PvdO family nonheme iron enzyme [Telmatocola sphagniphila]QVL30362.1 SUMF1/EgtB/PvdO family nonheme iron enzyme [Telmatocola sphagniphila]
MCFYKICLLLAFTFSNASVIAQDRSKHGIDQLAKKAFKQGFWLAKYPVTQREWTALMDSTPFAHHKNGRKKTYLKAVDGLDTSRFPAEQISREGTKAFLEKMNSSANREKIDQVFGKNFNFCLPYEDEWEYACRGGLGNNRAFYWGSVLNGDKANCNGQTPYGTKTQGPFVGHPTLVGAYKKRRRILGACAI